MNAEQIQLAEMIDRWVQEIVRSSSSETEADERLLETMYDYMAPFKQLMDNCSPLEMSILVNKYDGFYRFSTLLERLAQAIQDGTITVPDDTPLPSQPPKKKPRPRKPKRKRHTRKPRQPETRQQIRRDLSFLPMLTEAIVGMREQTEEQYALFAEAQHKPHVLDDEIVDRAIQMYEEQLTFIPLHEKQLGWWLSEELTEAQRYQVEDLKKKLPAIKEKTEQLLALLAELREGTINRILEMDDEELGRKFLRGEIKPPF